MDDPLAEPKSLIIINFFLIFKYSSFCVTMGSECKIQNPMKLKKNSNYHQDNFFWSNIGSRHIDFRGITSYQMVMLVVPVRRWRKVTADDLEMWDLLYITR